MQEAVVCDECDKRQENMRVCLECVQTLCDSCDKRIHNKGTRIRHQRVSTPQTVYEDDPLDLKIYFFAEQCY